MTNIINLQFPKCCECGVRGPAPDIERRIRRLRSAVNGDPFTFEIDACSPLDDVTALLAEYDRLQMENWQLKQACGYPIPADKETINNPFKCGMCDARHSPAVPEPASEAQIIAGRNAALDSHGA